MIEIDLDRVQTLREQIENTLSDAPVADCVGALEVVIADILAAAPGVDESRALRGAEAIAADVRNIIAERFAAVRSAH